MSESDDEILNLSPRPKRNYKNIIFGYLLVPFGVSITALILLIPQIDDYFNNQIPYFSLKISIYIFVLALVSFILNRLSFHFQTV